MPERDNAADAFRYKQSIVVRTDLKMSKGKIAAQVAHAAVSASDEARKAKRSWWERWITEGQMKVVLKVKNQEELEGLRQKAAKLGIPHSFIVDRGLTEIPPGSVTCLGIGPAPAEEVDKVTGNLPIL